MDVLVAGAGPVGLTVAYELARRGVRVRLVDAAPGPATTSRAVATHPRTLEVYDQMGVVDEMIARAVRITAFTLYADGRRLARLDADYTEIPTRYPYTLAMDQVLTEEVLREALAARGVAVEWGMRLSSFQQDADGVTARLEGAAGSEETRVGWLVGCDGGHSTVRKLLDLPLIGHSSETWLIADACVDTDLPRNSIYWLRVAGGSLMMAPLPGTDRWRMLDTVDVHDDGDAAAIAERFSRKLSAGVGSPVRVDPPGWVSVFTAQQRMVPRMGDGRVFVAGDAAHVHSPASGQGMNTGIQEAFNLAWKLAMVVHGEAGVSLLDTYSAERVPIGRQLLGSTRQATALVALRNRLAGALLPVMFGIVQRVPALRVRGQRKALGRVAGLNLGYPDGPLTTPAPKGPGPRPGQRVTQVDPDTATAPGWRALCAQLREPGWILLAFGPPVAAAAARAADRYGRWLHVRTVGTDLPDPDGRLAASLGAADGGWLLIRPDGYLAARGTELTDAAVDAALQPVTGRTTTVSTVDIPVPAPTRIKELALGLAHAAMLHAAVRLGVPDALGDEPASPQELGRAVNADPDPLGRVLRGLSHLGVFTRTEDGRYAHTELSRLLRRDHPRSMADMVLWAGAAWAWQAWPKLDESVRTGKPVVPDLYGKDFFTYLREDAGEDAHIFNRAMTQSSGLTSVAVVEALDLRGARRLVDIGGGQGHLLRTLLDAHPGLTGILFDLAPVIGDADPALRPGGEHAGRCELVPGDCLDAVPVDADIYLVKQVLKWDFDSSVRVLRNIAASARPGSRIVVVQNLVDDSPEPKVAAAMDLLLLLNVGGREHTLAEFKELFRRAGLDFGGVTPTRTPLRLIEAVVPA